MTGGKEAADHEGSPDTNEGSRDSEDKPDSEGKLTAGDGASAEGAAPAGGGQNLKGASARSWLTRRRTAAGAVLCLAVLAAASLGTWATDTWPFDKESYCWGAWQEDSGPLVLGDRLVGDGYKRSGEESAPPSSSSARATCSVRIVESADDSSDDSSSDDYDDSTDSGYGDSAGVDTSSASPEEVSRVTAEFGPVPRAADQRRSWLGDFFDAKAVPLPDGLPGFAGEEGGALVLPKACDRDGRPAAVTVRGMRGTTSLVGTEPDVADLLVAVANTAAEKAGCADDGPMRVEAPVDDSDTDDLGSVGKDTCRIPGFGFADRKEDHFRPRVGAVEDDVQTCTVDEETDVSAPGFAGQFVMAKQPRLAALFTGMTGDSPPGKGWRGKGKVAGGQGVLSAECGGERTVFYMNLGEELRSIARPGTRQVFARTANSVAERIGCETVAPRS